MSDESTARWALPLLAPGQAHKELFHNEALALLDLLVQPAVIAVGDNVPPDSPEPGQCWIVGPAPVGDWGGQAQALAGWTGGGWRFAPARAGLRVWVAAAAAPARFDGDGWTLGGVDLLAAPQPAIAAPAGGTIVDGAARDCLSAILALLRTHGLMADA